MRLLRGRSMPAMRAMLLSLLALPLLVLGVLADHADDPSPADDPALVAHLADRRPDLHLALPARVSTSGSASVTSTVCSKCADGDPSAVTAVHSSSRMRTSGPPRFTIGSIAKTMPGTSLVPLPGAP